jgi:hypothetical protein
MCYGTTEVVPFPIRRISIVASFPKSSHHFQNRRVPSQLVPRFPNLQRNSLLSAAEPFLTAAPDECVRGYVITGR